MVTLNAPPTISCPQCRQPIPTRLEQVFDAGLDPTAKERFLRGQFNVAQCPSCGFQGMIAAPLIYHDPNKELLLTYAPVELNLPLEEKERILGQLTRAVVNRLPAEARKGYLLQPKEMLTPQGMVERILEADGITPEMLEAQRKKVDLLRNLIAAEESTLPELITEHDEQIDPDFFELLNASAQQAAASNDQDTVKRLQKLHELLLEHSAFGLESKAQAAMVETAAKDLRDLGEGLNREKLLDMIVAAGDETRVRALASMARPLIDYEFLMQLTKRIETLADDERARLENVRETVLETIGQIDALSQVQGQAMNELLRALLEAEDLEAAIQQYLPVIDGLFLDTLGAHIEIARRDGKQDVAERLEQVRDKIMQVLQEKAPPEIRLINDLMALEDEEEAAALLKRRADELTPELLQAMAALAEDLNTHGRPEVGEKVAAYLELAERQMTLAKWTS